MGTARTRSSILTATAGSILQGGGISATSIGGTSPTSIVDLLAGGSISSNGVILVSSAGDTATSSVLLSAGSGGIAQGGAVDIRSAKSIGTSGGTTTLTGGASALSTLLFATSGDIIQSGNVLMQAAGANALAFVSATQTLAGVTTNTTTNFTQDSAGRIVLQSAETITANSGNGANATLTGGGNATSTLVLSASTGVSLGGTITAQTAGTLAMSLLATTDTTTSGTITPTTVSLGGIFAIASSGDTATSAIDVIAGNDISQTAGSIAAIATGGSATSLVLLSAASGGIVQAGGITASSTIAASIAGATSAASIIDLIAAGSLSQSSTGIILASAVNSAAPAASAISQVMLQAGTGVAQYGLINGSGTVGLAAGQGIVQTGTIISSTVQLGAEGTIVLSGLISAGSLITLASTQASIMETGTGQLRTPDGTLAASAMYDVLLTSGGNTIANLGNSRSNANKSFELYDTSSLMIVGNVMSVGAVVLRAGGAIGEASGVGITAASLSGSAGSSVSLASTSNMIGMLGSFTAGGDFNLNDGQSLLVAGPVSAGGTAGIAVSAAGSLILAGDITAGAGDVSLTASGDIDQIGGVVRAAHTLTLISSNGNIGEASGAALDAEVLTGSAPGSVSLLGAANSITSLANFASGGNFALIDASALGISGNVSAVDAMTLVSAGSITQTGELSARRLTGSASGTASFGNVVLGSLDDFSVALSGTTSTLSVTTPGNIMLSGTIAAKFVTIASSGTITIADGTDIRTGGDPTYRRQPSTSQAPKGPASGAGAFLAATEGLVVDGLLTVTPFGQAANPVLDLTSRNMVLGGAPGGIFGPQTNLFLNLGSNGLAVGNINVDFLAIFYTRSPQQKTLLTGQLRSTAGAVVTGNAAAGTARLGFGTGPDFIFRPDAKFELNGCPIASVNCVILSGFSQVPILPLFDISIEIARDRKDDLDILLPDVSDTEF